MSCKIHVGMWWWWCVCVCVCVYVCVCVCVCVWSVVRFTWNLFSLSIQDHSDDGEIYRAH